MSVLERVQRRWAEKGVIAQNMNREALLGSIDRADGLNLSIDAENVICRFQYRVVALPEVPGKAPTAMMASVPPLSQALPVLRDELASLVVESSREHFKRLGILVDARLSEDELPPGVEALLSRVRSLARPLGVTCARADVTVVSVTKQDLVAGTRDLCHQKIVVDEGRPRDVRLLLDYQRYWTKVQMRAGRSFIDVVAAVERDALAFFEQIGAGELE